MEVLKSIEFNMEDICETSDVVLLDSSIFGKQFNFLREIYDCKDSLDFDFLALHSESEFSSTLFQITRLYPNLYTIQGVVDEKRKYLDLLNQAIIFHSNRLASLRGSRKSRRISKKDKRYEDCEKVEAQRTYELGLVRDMEIYARSIFRWVDYLGDRVIPIKNTDRFQKLKGEVSQRRLKVDFSHRYELEPRKGNPKIESNADESLAFVAYEQAVNHKNVSIVSNDSDLCRILSFCFEKGHYELPRDSHVALYSRFYGEKYELQFDNIFYLCGPGKEPESVFHYHQYNRLKTYQSQCEMVG